MSVTIQCLEFGFDNGIDILDLNNPDFSHHILLQYPPSNTSTQDRPHDSQIPQRIPNTLLPHLLKHNPQRSRLIRMRKLHIGKIFPQKLTKRSPSTPQLILQQPLPRRHPPNLLIILSINIPRIRPRLLHRPRTNLGPHPHHTQSLNLTRKPRISHTQYFQNRLERSRHKTIPALVPFLDIAFYKHDFCLGIRLDEFFGEERTRCVSYGSYVAEELVELGTAEGGTDSVIFCAEGVNPHVAVADVAVDAGEVVRVWIAEDAEGVLHCWDGYVS